MSFNANEIEVKLKIHDLAKHTNLAPTQQNTS